jgi:hypothetical protein
VLRILSLSHLKPLEIDSPWIGFGLRLGKFSFDSPLLTPGGRRVQLGGEGGAWATGSVWPAGCGTGLAWRPGTRWLSGAWRCAPSGNGHWANCWANGDGLEQAETRSRPVVGFAQGRRGREIAGPAEVLAQKHSEALLNSKTFIVSKYI